MGKENRSRMWPNPKYERSEAASALKNGLVVETKDGVEKSFPEKQESGKAPTNSPTLAPRG